MKYSFLGVLALMFVLSACGGGATNNAAPAPANTGGGTQENKAPENKPDDTPKEDTDKWKKVTTPTPEGWDDLSKDGLNELTSAKYNLLKKAPGDAPLIAKFADKHAPHASSGSDEEWQEWRENVSAVMIYNVSKTRDDMVDTLKKRGGDFLDGFDSTKVGEAKFSGSPFGAYIHADDKQKMLACVSNENGTYILVGIVRSDDARNLLDPYPTKIKPE